MSAHCDDCGADLVYGTGEDWQLMTCPRCEIGKERDALAAELAVVREERDRLRADLVASTETLRAIVAFPLDENMSAGWHFAEVRYIARQGLDALATECEFCGDDQLVEPPYCCQPVAAALSVSVPDGQTAPRKHQALGRCWCGETHDMAAAIELNTPSGGSAETAAETE